jgi:hypothetical protein
VPIALGDRSYDIHIGSGLLADPASWAGLPSSADALIVTNTTVAPLYAESLAAQLRQRHFVRARRSRLVRVRKGGRKGRAVNGKGRRRQRRDAIAALRVPDQRAPARSWSSHQRCAEL